VNWCLAKNGESMLLFCKKNPHGVSRPTLVHYMKKFGLDKLREDGKLDREIVENLLDKYKEKKDRSKKQLESLKIDNRVLTDKEEKLSEQICVLLCDCGRGLEESERIQIMSDIKNRNVDKRDKKKRT